MGQKVKYKLTKNGKSLVFDSRSEAAEYLGISPRVLWHLADAGKALGGYTVELAEPKPPKPTEKTPGMCMICRCYTTVAQKYGTLRNLTNCDGEHCAGCGFELNEANRRKALIETEGLTEIDGLKRLIIRRGE